MEKGESRIGNLPMNSQRHLLSGARGSTNYCGKSVVSSKALISPSPNPVEATTSKEI